MNPDDVDTDLLRAALDEQKPRLQAEAIVSAALCLVVGVADVVRALTGDARASVRFGGVCVFVGAFVLTYTLVRHRRHRRLWERGVESLERLERMKTR